MRVEAGLFVGAARGGVARVAAGADRRDEHARFLHPGDREFIHRRSDAVACLVGMDGIQPNFADQRFFPQLNQDEPDDGAVRFGDVNIPARSGRKKRRQELPLREVVAFLRDAVYLFRISSMRA